MPTWNILLWLLSQILPLIKEYAIAYYTLEEFDSSLNYILEFMDQIRAQGERKLIKAPMN